MLFNELPRKTTVLKKDQLVYLQRKKNTGKKTYHRVRKGETLVEISQKEGVQLASLLKFNKLKAGQQPKSGQKLLLKGPISKEKTSVKSSNKKSANQTKSAIHVVRNGESLWTIARKYNVTVNSIKNANKLKSEDLDIGQSLKIQK